MQMKIHKETEIYSVVVAANLNESNYITEQTKLTPAMRIKQSRYEFKKKNLCYSHRARLTPWHALEYTLHCAHFGRFFFLFLHFTSQLIFRWTCNVSVYR